MLKTFQMAKRFKLIVQPELILLQKTLLNIEGLGRQLYPNLDIWQVSEPILRDIMRSHYGPQRALDQVKQNLPKWIEQAAELPTLVHEYLSLKTKPLPRHVKLEQQQLRRDELKIHRRSRLSLLTTGLIISTALLYLFDDKHYLWHNIPTSAVIGASLSALLSIFLLRSK